MATLAKIGRYEIAGRLATGGMAEIFLARITGQAGFERPVVVKRILPHLARQRQFREMFLDEARIVARIRHPAVVQVHELGEEAGELFLVLEYLEGETLSNLRRALQGAGRALDHVSFCHVLAEACAGLHAAHELTGADGGPLGLVHRDVSPQNIFVTYTGEVKLLDFGIAKAEDRIARTEAGQVKGKFHYMSPEQCQGRPLDRRSDVFSLGIVAYELATGVRLFKRATQLATLQAVVSEPIDPPSSLAPGLPPSLDAVVMRALARDVSARYATAAEMRRALLVALRDLSSAGPADVDEPSAKLAAIMKDVFAERMRDKREMLRRVSAGSAVTDIPTDDHDDSIEASTAAAPSGTALGSAIDGVERQRRPRRGSRLPWVLAGGVTIASALALAFVYRPGAPGGASSAPAAAASAAASVPAAAAASAQSAAPAAPPAPAPAEVATTVTVRVESKPLDAQVWVDGTLRGATPASVTLPRGGSAVALELRHAGYAPASQPLVPDQDQKVVIVLEADRSAAPATPAPKAAGTPKPASSKGSGFWKFQ